MLRDAETRMLAGLTALVVFAMFALVVAAPAEPVPAKACWVETKADAAHERICGDVADAPPGSTHFADVIPNEDEPAFDCIADGNGVCGPVPAYRLQDV